MKNSSMPSLVTTGPGGICSRKGNRVGSLATNHFSSEEWKVGKMLGELGISMV